MTDFDPKHVGPSVSSWLEDEGFVDEIEELVASELTVASEGTGII